MKQKVTIRNNGSLIRLAQLCKCSIDVVTQELLNKLTEYELIYLDEIEQCGRMLPDLLHDQNKTLTSFTLKVFKKCFPELLEIMNGIQFWGLDDDCSECGCEMEYPGLFNDNYSKCTNCGNEKFDYEYDPDQYRDDCINLDYRTTNEIILN